MKNIFDNSEIANFVGLIAMLLIIWVGGPYIKLGGSYIFSSPTTRLLMIAFLLTIWVVRIVVLKFLKYRADKKVISALTDANEPGKNTTDEQKALITKNVSLIMKRLNQGRGFFGKWLSSRNPWFIVTGLPDNGKSFLLEKAGLQRPIYDSISNHSIMESQKEKIGCWWFSENTFFLETNILKESKGSGFDFVDALKKYRHYAPVSGIVFVDDISHLLLMEKDDIINHARTLKAYLTELHNHLGVILPIHFMFSQCDRIAGFKEFFYYLTPQDREKAFGITINSANSEDLKTTFEEKYDHLISQVRKETLRSLSKLDTRSSNLAINFPQQLAMLKQSISEFLSELFKINGEELYTLQGVYFSSASQKSVPQDIYLKKMRSAFQLNERQPSPEGEGEKGYFLYNIFKSHIFESLDQVMYNKKTRWMFKVVRFIAYAFSVTAITIYAVFYIGSYMLGTKHLDQIKDSITSYQHIESQTQKKIQSLPDLLPQVDILYQLSSLYPESEESGSHGYSLFSLYEFKKIHEGFKEALCLSLYYKFMPLVFNRVETLLIAEKENVEKISNLLKAYLAFSNDNRGGNKNIPLVMDKDIKETYKGQPEIAKKLVYYLNLAIERDIPHYPINESLVREKQKVLNQTIPLDRIYKRLQDFADKKYPLPYIPSYGLAPEFYLVFRSKTNQTIGIPVFYTVKGFHEVLQAQGPIIIDEILTEDALIGLDKNNPLEVQSKDALLSSLKELYENDYISFWHAFLEDQEIVSFQSLEEAIKVLNLFAGKQAILLKLLDIVSTHLSSVLPSKQVLDVGHATELLNFITLTQSLDKKPPEIQAIIAPMVRMIDFLSSLANAVDSDKACFLFTKAYLVDQSTPNPIQDVKLISHQLPSPLKEWIERIADQSWDLALQKATVYINKNWKADFWNTYEKDYLPFYPFTPTAEREVSLASFKKMFGPAGILETFYEAYIQPFIGLDNDEWRWIGSSNETIGISSEHLKIIESALSLQKELFDEKGNFSLSVDLKPYTLDSNLAGISLDGLDQNLVYRHGPPQTKTFHWPAREPSQNACQITMVDFKDQNTTLKFEGVWGLFRMFNKFTRSSAEGPGSHIMTVSASGYKAQFVVRSSPDIKVILSRLNSLHLLEILCDTAED